jgi:hypothetical protein
MQILPLPQRCRLAAWVNSHDDGTPQPRATVTDLGVAIRSAELHPSGSLVVFEEIAYSCEQARVILGY